MSFIPLPQSDGAVLNADYFMEAARGTITGHSTVNKFGRNTNVDATATDIWDLTSQPIWVAPTTARTHDITSTSASDDGAPVGVGARTIQVYGLTSWSTAEVSEVITLNGTANVATANSYVIIHRMNVLTKGATDVNVGTITATAQTDGTVTAQINIGQGQTQMAIYGVPSTQTAYMTKVYFSLLRSSPASALADCKMLYNPEPDNELLNYLEKYTTSKSSVATSEGPGHIYQPPNKFVGPGIIKLQAFGSTTNLDISAGFDLVLIDN